MLILFTKKIPIPIQNILLLSIFLLQTYTTNLQD